MPLFLLSASCAELTSWASSSRVFLLERTWRTGTIWRICPFPAALIEQSAGFNLTTAEDFYFQLGFPVVQGRAPVFGHLRFFLARVVLGQGQE